MTIDEVREFIYQGLGGKFTNLNKLSKFTTIIEAQGMVSVDVYTDSNKYNIVGTTNGYLGCIATTRKAIAGENHLRGNDLADGELNQETMFRILQDIISYELVDE